MPKVLWLLFIIISGETELDEAVGTINMFEDRARCERAGQTIAADFEETGKGEVKRNDDGTYCISAPVDFIEGKT